MLDSPFWSTWATVQNTTTSSQTNTSQIHGDSTCIFILKINHLRLSICCTASPSPVPKVQSWNALPCMVNRRTQNPALLPGFKLQLLEVFPWERQSFIITPTSQHTHQIESQLIGPWKFSHPPLGSLARRKRFSGATAQRTAKALEVAISSCREFVGYSPLPVCSGMAL